MSVRAGNLNYGDDERGRICKGLVLGSRNCGVWAPWQSPWQPRGSKNEGEEEEELDLNKLLPSPVPKHPTTTLPKAQIKNEDLLLSLLSSGKLFVLLSGPLFFYFETSSFLLGVCSRFFESFVCSCHFWCDQFRAEGWNNLACQIGRLGFIKHIHVSKKPDKVFRIEGFF